MRQKINWDALGITASLLCAIHCAILPLFLAALPLFGVNIIDNAMFETGMILLAFVIGCYALWHGYRWHHHSKMPLLIFSLGIGFLFLKQVFLRYHFFFLVPAVTLIITAHLLNYRYCRKHNHAHATDCDHDHY